MKVKMNKRIKWTYQHALNSVSCTPITKQGDYLGKIQHTKRFWQKPEAVQMACVQFDGNKRTSFVPFEELIFVNSEQNLKKDES